MTGLWAFEVQLSYQKYQRPPIVHSYIDWSNLRLFIFSIFLVFCDFFMSCRHVCSMGRNVRFMRWYHTPYLCHLWVEPTYLCSVHIGFHFRNRCNRVVGFCESGLVSCSKRVTMASKLRTQTREVIHLIRQVLKSPMEAMISSWKIQTNYLLQWVFFVL